MARALQPGDLEGVSFFAHNPIGWAAADDHLDIVQAIGVAVLVAGVAGCLLSLAVRWLRAGPLERRQLEGLALVGLVVAVVVPVVPLLPDPFTVLYAVAMTVFPIVLTLAVLELHLDAIDRILRATVTAFVAVAVLAVIYLAIVDRSRRTGRGFRRPLARRRRPGHRRRAPAPGSSSGPARSRSG